MMGAIIEDSFYSGRYNDCKRQIESTLHKDSDDIGFLYMLSKVNLNTCNTASWLSKTAIYEGMDVKNFVTCYKDYLELLKGLPADIELFDLSLGILYNCGYLLLNTNRTDIFEKEWLKLATKTICNGIYLLKIDNRLESVSWKGNEINTLLKFLIALGDKSEELFTNTTAVQVLLIYYSLLCNKLEHVGHSLGQIWKTAKKSIDCPIGKCLMLGFNDQERGQKCFLLRDLLHIISVGYFVVLSTNCTEQDMGNCLESLNNLSNNDKLIPSKLLINGFSLWKFGKCDELFEQLGDVQKNRGMNCQISLLLNNLVGCAFSEKGKVNLAIQKFKECISMDFAFKAPLWNVAAQYRQKGLYDVELECLNLLVLSLSDGNGGDIENGGATCAKNLIDSTLDRLTDLLVPNISLEQALYLFANRCLILKKYGIAAEKYILLLDLLSKEKNPIVEIKSFPEIRQIYIEAAYAQVKVKKFDTAVMICEIVLSKNSAVFSQSLSDSQSQSEPGLFDEPTILNNEESQSSQPLTQTLQPMKTLPDSNSAPAPVPCTGMLEALPAPFVDPMEFQLITFNYTTRLSKGRKRQRTLSEQTDSVTALGIDMSASVYLVHALIQLGKLEEASSAIDNALRLVEQGTMFGDFLSSYQVNKKAKTETDTGTDNSQLREHFAFILPWFQILLRKRVHVLCAQTKTKEAIQSSRMTIQMCSDDVHAWYDHVQLLKSVGRERDAWASWLNFRKIDTRIDSQATSELKDNIKAKIKNFTSEEEQLFLKLDEESIANCWK
ncbi:uncharacterized protein LOC141901251 [Tubulanus polymorphus]|uniref:uncharacterized protein LOC141901251 n=1 Tax=Tubulanus polymorphus TaxID=672921 RepID=UPI003DA21DB1